MAGDVSELPLRRILLLEDNPMIRESFAHAVGRLAAETKTARFELLQAEDGGTAWELLQLHSFALVVTDLYVPVLSGLDLIARIRESEALHATRVLAISASIEDARMRALGTGADMFLQKPLRLVDVLDAVRSLLHLDNG